MATVSTWLNSVRYDLRNYADIDWDPDQVIHYLNRAVDILDQRLASINSDQTFTQGSDTLSSGDDYISTPSNCLAIREVWIGQDRKTNVSMDELYYRRRFRTSDSTEPNFWCWVQNEIQFEVEADDDYTVVYMYDKGTSTLASSSDMPYNDSYNNILREVTVLMCIHKKNKKDSPTDALYVSMFDQILFMDTINRRFVRKEYKLDF